MPVGERVARRPVGGRLVPVQEPGRAEEPCAGADRRDPPSVSGHGGEVAEEPVVVAPRPGSLAADHHEGVEGLTTARHAREGDVGLDGDAALRAHPPRSGASHADGVRRVGAEPGRAAQHLDRTGQVEELEAVEGHDEDAVGSHPGIIRRPPFGSNAIVLTIPANQVRGPDRGCSRSPRRGPGLGCRRVVVRATPPCDAARSTDRRWGSRSRGRGARVSSGPSIGTRAAWRLRWTSILAAGALLAACGGSSTRATPTTSRPSPSTTTTVAAPEGELSHGPAPGVLRHARRGCRSALRHPRADQRRERVPDDRVRRPPAARTGRSVDPDRCRPRVGEPDGRDARARGPGVDAAPLGGHPGERRAAGRALRVESEPG